jgi:hypothetical protein
MSNHEANITKFPNQQPTRTIKLRHVFEVFDEFSKGDVDAGASAVQHLNAAQIRNTRDIISKSLKSTGRKSQVFNMYSEVDPETYASYDKTVGMTQRSPDGNTFVATDVVTNNQGEKQLISLAFTTQLREEIRTMLGNPQSEASDDIAA